MKNNISLLIKLFLFWISYFVWARILFHLYHFDTENGIGLLDFLKTFQYGFLLDLSLTSYLMMVTCLLLALSSVFPRKVINISLFVFHTLLFSISNLLVIGDLGTYSEWGFRLDASVLRYLKTPTEALASTDLKTYAVLISILLVTSFIFIRLLKKILLGKVIAKQKFRIVNALAFIFLSALFFIPVRGGVSIVPINISRVYFSNNQFVNQSSVNVVWYFNSTLLYQNKNSDSYSFMEDDKATEIFGEVNAKSANSKEFIHHDKPNVLVIILESFTKKAIHSFGSELELTPNFDSIASQGIKFTNLYASGTRSDKGLVAILSSYPSQPIVSITEFPNKMAALPSLVQPFNDAGYSSSFYYGGNIKFANLKSYLKIIGFQNIISDSDFPYNKTHGKWGAHDQESLQRLNNDLEQQSEPFINVLFTLSSHPPFDQPGSKPFGIETDEARFKNSVLFTDSCLGEFFKTAKQSSWWDNTLVILVADHGTKYFHHNPHWHPDKFKIPMVWTGGVIESPAEISKFGDQTDIASTLLAQLGMETKAYPYGKNLTDKLPGRAFYRFNNGYGILDSSNVIVYDFLANKRVLIRDSANTELQIKAEAILQIQNKDYQK